MYVYFLQMDGFKKVIPIDLKTLTQEIPKDKYSFVCMGIVENSYIVIDPAHPKEKIKFESKITLPTGILLKLFCFPENKIIKILKCQNMTLDEERCLQLQIVLEKNKTKNLQNEEEQMVAAVQEYEDDMNCSIALEVSHNSHFIPQFLFFYVIGIYGK